MPRAIEIHSKRPILSVGAREIGFICLYIEASLALVCLLGLLFGDPGTLKRSPELCFPLPQLVAEKLRQGQTLSRMENIHEGGQVFCVRCCIWRPDASPPHYQDTTHHCSTCQRCVTHFDHHCGVRGKPARQACEPSLRDEPARQACATSLRDKPARQACEPSSSGGRTLPQAFCLCPRSSLIAPPPNLGLVHAAGLRPVHCGQGLGRQHGLLSGDTLVRPAWRRHFHRDDCRRRRERPRSGRAGWRQWRELIRRRVAWRHSSIGIASGAVADASYSTVYGTVQ